MASLLQIDDIPSFGAVREIPASDVIEALRDAVRKLHEAEEIEEFLRSILSDRAATPHGPAELVDIFTHKLTLRASTGLAAFILKGRSFRTVTPKDVAHQIYRLEKIDGLQFAAFGATGVILDAAKEQFVSTCIRLNIDYSILDADDFSLLFWAYGFLCPRDGNRITGGRCVCGYRPTHSVLNILQNEALSELQRSHELGDSKALVVLPPGSGKTRIAARDSKSSGAKTILYIAHTHEILDVAYTEFSATFGANQVAKIEKRNEIDSAPICLMTIQFLEHNLAQIAKHQFDYLVIDEFHHAAAKTYRSAIKKLNYIFLLGLTATPFRGDRQDIAELCDGNIVVNYELRSGIDTGVLVPYHYFGCFDDIDYQDLPIVAGRYIAKDLERRLFIKERHDAIVAKWRELAEGKPTLTFCCSHKHAERLANAFKSAGVPAATYLYHHSSDDRARLLQRMQNGKLKVLCTVDVLNEGADMPFIECLVFVRPTESKRIFVQQLGRGLRKYVGKAHCVVIDFIGNFRNAYKIVEYQGLRPDEIDSRAPNISLRHNFRDVLDLPLGCKVHFDEKVLDIFAQQTLDPRNATRSNIARILFYEYQRWGTRLGRSPSAKDLDRYALLDSQFYKLVFGSWKAFTSLVATRARGGN